MLTPSSNDLANFHRFFGIFWKCARVGERLSPYVSICCIIMAVSVDFHESSLSNISDYWDTDIPLFRKLVNFCKLLWGYVFMFSYFVIGACEEKGVTATFRQIMKPA